jgi:phage tail sheath protein FI
MQFTTPGVYIQEITGPGVIVGVGTSTAAFLGPAASGSFTPTVITSFDDFKRMYGRPSDGWPYLASVTMGKRYYLGYAVQGFFQNGGTRAVILRVGTAKLATWNITDLAGDMVFQLEALAEGAGPNQYSITVATSGLAGANAPALAYVEGTISKIDVPKSTIVVANASPISPAFVPGDIVTFSQAGTDVGQPTAIVSITPGSTGTSIVLAKTPPSPADKVRLADIAATTETFRLAKPSTAVQPGSLVRLNGADFSPVRPSYYAVVQRTDANGFVYLRAPFFQREGTDAPWTVTLPLTVNGTPRGLETLDFSLTVSDPSGQQLDLQDGLSLDPFHSGYIFRRDFNSVRVVQPTSPPPSRPLSQLRLAQDGAPVVLTVPTQGGAPDNPDGLLLQDYEDALEQLQDVDDVNMVCIPDGANDASIQRAAIDHCELMKDRIAVLDVPGSGPADPAAALVHLAAVVSDGGRAALYYPWLSIPDVLDPSLPRPLLPLPLSVPPSGYIAGVMARVDQELGVHYAPANTEVRGAMGLARVLSDREQGLINLQGVNALRIFPGDARVIVWGARTTAPEDQTDWTYVNVRRLLLYIEKSIEKGIRFAVFKPNAFPLWQSLTRTISEFLDRVWRDGGLAGKTRDQAYQVRIDEGLNPPFETAQGHLNIEIQVAPVRPAEFIIVRIGLWDGGAQVTES